MYMYIYPYASLWTTGISITSNINEMIHFIRTCAGIILFFYQKYVILRALAPLHWGKLTWPCNDFRSYEEEFLLIKLHLWLPSWQINFVFFFIFFFAYDFGILGYITVKNRYKNPVSKLFLVPISGFYGILSIKKYKIGIRSKCPGVFSLRFRHFRVYNRKK